LTRPVLISGGRIIDPSQRLDMTGDLLIHGGRVVQVGEKDSISPGQQDYTIISAQGMVISPGFIDLHCHLREPGFEEKETIATGTRSAARGGFTTICCMPNTNPPIDTPATVEYIQNKAKAEGMVRVLSVGCITQGRKGENLVEMEKLARAGVIGFSDDGSAVASSRLMRHALEYSLLFGLPVIEHCEDTAISSRGVMNEGWVASRLGLEGIPAAAEEVIVARDIALAELTRAWIHIAHVSTAGSVEIISRAKEKGICVTAEVTPHHLILTEEKVMGYDTNAKVNPPLRTKKDIDALVQGLKVGTIDAIATDHAPHTLVDKQCEFAGADFGISGFETALGSLMTLVHSGQLDLMTLVSKLTMEPARILHNGCKRRGSSPLNDLIPEGLGTLGVGAPADVTVFHPEMEWTVDVSTFASKGKNTPWEGCLLSGKVTATIVGGEIVYRDDALKVEAVRH